MGLAVAYLRPPVGGPVPEAIVPEPAFEIFRVDTEVVGGRLVQVMPKPDFTFAARRGPRGDHAADARRVPDEPEQSDRRVDAARRDSRDRAPRAERSGRVRRRGVRRVCRDDVHSGTAGVSKRHRRAGRSRRRSASPACASAVSSARLTCSIPCARSSRSTASTSPRSSRCRRRWPTPHILRDYLRQVQESKALLYAACDRLGLEVLEERRELRAGLAPAIGCTRSSRALPIAASTSATARPSPAAPAAVRIATGIVEHTRRFIAAMEEVLCAAP